MTGTNLANLSLEQTQTLRTASTRLAEHFAGTFGQETVEKFLHSSFDQFASRASVPNFLPLLAERFARQRLYALAKVEGKINHGTPTVLFLCTHTPAGPRWPLGSSGATRATVPSHGPAGRSRGTRSTPAAVAAMRERSIDITDEFPKPWTDEIVRAADVVVTMGCGDACPVCSPARDTLEDPAGQGVDAVRPIRDEIDARVRGLLDELHLEVHA